MKLKKAKAKGNVVSTGSFPETPDPPKSGKATWAGPGVNMPRDKVTKDYSKKGGK